jgi:predicted ATPase
MLIEQIQVKGYKSLVDATLHVRPLTLLAGTNSSGKSSIMQPLLLIKQTMEAPYNPAGALVLSGAHVQAETAGELVSKLEVENDTKFSIQVDGLNILREENSNKIGHELYIKLNYSQHEENFLLLQQDSKYGPDPHLSLRSDKGLSYEELSRFYNKAAYGDILLEKGFYFIMFHDEYNKPVYGVWPSYELEGSIALLMHIPGLRSKPQRSYPNTFFKDQIKGTFDLYAAGTISQWQQQNNTEALALLNDSLQRLGLTNAVTAKVKNANEVELSVNRLPAASKAKPKKADMVNIADVGIGVSQVLPILVALIAAQEGQIVYVEQPELHLHPRAQVAMGELLAEAANRGVRVIVETHSSLLLLTVQTLIAQGKIAHTDVGLHWFTRNAKGATEVQYVQPDEDGAYGEWPEDFSEIELKAQDAYLTAVGLRQFGEAAQ